MSIDFERGYKYVLDNVGGAIGADISQTWIDSINQNVENMTQDMLSTAQAKNLDVDRLQGFMAEIWHTHTFNANATIHHSSSVATQPDVNTFGSADVVIGKHEFSLKSYNTEKGSYQAQAESPWERYCKLKSQAEHKGKSYQSFDEFLKERGLENDKSAKMSMYYEQGKVISSDMLNGAKALLHKKILSLEGDSSPTPESKLQLERYKEVYHTLTDVVGDGKGNESIQLSHSDAIKLAKAAKAGDIDKELLAECGLDINKLVTAKDIACESLKAGLSAATFSLILSITPTIVNGISMLISSGEIDVESLKDGGASALPATARSFLSGSITAALNTSCQTGKLGEALVGADPMVISTLVVVTIGTIGSALKLASGKISKAEMAHEIMQMYVTTAFSYAGGVALAALFEGFPFAYMIGSFIGGIVGGFIYSATEKLFMSFCVDSGCTFFGLVDQNYTLPERVIEELGLEQFNFEKMTIEQFEYDTFSIDKFSLDSFEYEKFGIEILRRDLIGVYSVGYA